MKRRHRSDLDSATIVRLYTNGRTASSIAKELGVHWETILRLLRNSGCSIRDARLLSPTDRFWAKVDTSGGVAACWQWRNNTVGGYGRVGFGGRLQLAHRVAWTLVKGQIPLGMCVLHYCDTPQCVNPGHLYLGTHLSNSQDRDAKGRQFSGQQQGSLNGASLLTESDVEELRDLSKMGMSRAMLATRYGVSISTIGSAIRGDNWGHVPRAIK